MDRIDEILFLYEDDVVEMANGGSVRKGPTAKAIDDIIKKQTVFESRSDLRDKIKTKIGKDPGVMRPARYPSLKKAKYKDEMSVAEARDAEKTRLEKGRKELAERRAAGQTTRQIKAKKKAENEILRQQRDAAKVKAAEALLPENLAGLNRTLKKGEKDILYKSYDNIFREEYDRLLKEGDLFSKTDLNRAIINRIADENPTIDLQKGIGLDKIPGGGSEESKTLFENIEKKFTKKQLANFTTNTNALAYTKNQDRLLQALLTGNNDFDDLMNNLDFNEGRLKGNVNKLMKNLAQTDKSRQPLFFRKYSPKELEQARNAIYESPTLESVYQRTIVQSVLQSTKLGSPERKQALEKLKEFNQFKKAMQNNGIDAKLIALDHAASYRAIKNGNLKNFLAVTPIMSDINAIKSTFDRRSQLNLRRMQDAIETGDNATYKQFLKNQTELEGIWKTMTGDQSSLGKIRVQPGGKSKGVTKIFDFGATSILEKDKNLINELGDNLKIRQNIVNASTQTNLDEVSRIMFEGSAAQKPKQSALPESFKKLDNPKMFKVENKISQYIQNIGCPGKAKGGRVDFNTGGSTVCFKKGVEKLKGDPRNLSPGDQANLRSLGKLTKIGRGALFVKNVLGPGAILGEAIIEGGIAANKFMDQGLPIKQALGESYINKYVLGPKTQIDLEAERAKEMEKGEEFAMAERGRRMEPFMAQGEYADRLRRKKREQQREAAFPTVAPEVIDEILATQDLTVEDTGLDYGQIQDIIKREDQTQAIADAGGVANMAGGGIAGIRRPNAIPPESGPNSQGLENLKYYVTNT